MLVTRFVRVQQGSISPSLVGITVAGKELIGYYIPYVPCMVYGWFLGQMLVNIPYMEHMGMLILDWSHSPSYPWLITLSINSNKYWYMVNQPWWSHIFNTLLQRYGFKSTDGTRLCPPVISWFINHSKYRYIYHKPSWNWSCVHQLS